MGLKGYLTEERLSGGDKRMFLKLMDERLRKNKKVKAHFVMKSFKKDYTDEEREVDVKHLSNGLSFTYNADHFELTNTLVDIADDMGYEFKTNTERNINTTTFTVMV